MFVPYVPDVDERVLRVAIDKVVGKTLKEMKEYLRSKYEKRVARWERHKGATSLHFAAYLGKVDATKMLIEVNADVNASDEKKWAAIHYAAMDGHADVVKVLLQNGAKVNAVTTDGRTALHIACRYRSGDVANVLIQNGADVNAASKDEGTALRIAAVKDNIPCTLQLLCFGAEIDEQTIEKDKTKLLRPVEDRLKSLRDGKRMEVSLMSEEERRFMWDLGFVLAVKHPTIAFTTYQRIRSFVTFHGIFMGPGYCLGKGSVWRR
jgi:hypothetical protein